MPCLEPLTQHTCARFCADEMRYGRISHCRRSWSKVGARTSIDRQPSCDHRDRFSASAPRAGKRVHLSRLDGVDSNAAHACLLELKKEYPDTMVVAVWDHAPGHRPTVHRERPGLIIRLLPPDSPALHPAERCCAEGRQATAGRIFTTIAAQETVIDDALNLLADDTDGMRQLTGDAWMKQPWEGVV